MIWDVLTIILLFALFGSVHSILASKKIKNFVRNAVGSKIAFYRFFYNLISIVTFYLAFSLSPKPDVIIYDLNYPYDLLVLLPQILAILGFIYTLRFFDNSSFLGTSQIVDWFKGNYNENDLDEKLSLNINGPFKFTRHPLYFFSIFFLVFRPVMDLFYLTALICVIIYFYIGSHFEEKKLIDVFGEKYLTYMKQTPRIFPVKFFKRNYEN